MLIRTGRLSEGGQLPAVARMATLLGVSKNTILGAYECLADLRLVESQPNRGHFVTHHRSRLVDDGLAESLFPNAPAFGGAVSVARSSGVCADVLREPLRFDFRVGRPSVDAFPQKQFIRLSNQLLRDSGGAMAEYVPAAGLWGLRVQVADYLASAKALKVEPDQVLITAGSQEALSLICSHFLDAHATAVFESPCYAGFRNLVQRHGARPVPVRIDSDGIRTQELPKGPAKLVYVTPSHQYPLGHTLSHSRRVELLGWAARAGALVVEDDYDGDFCYDAVLPRPLAAISPHQVIYVGTFSKTLGPALRLGYMVCPPSLTNDFVARKALLNNGTPWLSQAFMARYLDGNSFAHHLQFLRRQYRGRRDELLQGLKAVWRGEGTVSGHNAGMHVILPP